MKHPIIEQFYTIGIIPVLAIDSVGHAKPLAESLRAGGLPVAEVTLRTTAAIDSIRVIVRAAADVIVGAGTVLNREQAEAARDAGAQFLVTPGIVEEVALWAQEQGIPILAGAVTPTEMIRAMDLGLDILKFFPAEAMGGLSAIKALSDPFPQLKFIPTGGISIENVVQYLQDEKVVAIGGSWMAKPRMIAEGKFDEITQLAREASDLVKGVRKTPH